MVGIYSIVNFSDFVDGFTKAGRGDQFSRSALRELYYYYNCLSEDLGEPVVFDPIAICCDWIECTEEEAREHVGFFGKADIVDYLDSKTTVLRSSNGNILYQQF